MPGLLIILVLSYLVGSFPTSIVVGRSVKGIDIRDYGSGNAGMTNVFRVLGWKPAMAVGMVDIFKGWMTAAYFPSLPVGQLAISDHGTLQILTGFSAVLGHTFTVFAGFRGGKGVATLAGVLLALYPVAVPFCFIIFSLVLMRWGYVSVSSMVTAVALPVFVYLLPKLGFEKAGSPLVILSLFIPLFVIITHRSNIRRLREGTEKRFDQAVILRRHKKI